MDIENVNADIITYLQDLGACWRCAVRFTRDRSPKSYVRKPVDVKQEPEAKISKTSPCILCLGLVQDKFMDESYVNNICQQVMKADYDSPSFSCMVSLPVSLMMREQAAWFHLTAKFPQLLSPEIKASAEQITNLKDVWKFAFTETMALKLGKQFEFNSSPFQVTVNVCYKDDESECACLVEMCPEKFKHRYKQTRVFREGIFTRNAVQSVLSQVSSEKFFQYYELKVPEASFTYGDVQCAHNSIHVAGRYNKYSRTLCQTPWVINGVKHMETSVQELICPELERFFRVQSIKFSSSGREDVDVRTLGLGRPFAIELLDPHKTLATKEELAELQRLINSSTTDIKIRYLQLVEKDQLNTLKQGEEEKTKIYSALCVTLDHLCLTDDEMARLNGVTGLVIKQKTPLRVLHRRSLDVRPRTIHEMSAKKLADYPGHFIVHVKTQAGTYIKEFVHGDFDRTVPSLCTLLGRPVDIVALDVDAVELDWPPPTE